MTNIRNKSIKISVYAVPGTDISDTIQRYKGGFKNYCSTYVVELCS